MVTPEKFFPYREKEEPAEKGIPGEESPKVQESKEDERFNKIFERLHPKLEKLISDLDFWWQVYLGQWESQGIGRLLVNAVVERMRIRKERRKEKFLPKMKNWQKLREGFSSTIREDRQIV